MIIQNKFFILLQLQSICLITSAFHSTRISSFNIAKALHSSAEKIAKAKQQLAKDVSSYFAKAKIAENTAITRTVQADKVTDHIVHSLRKTTIPLTSMSSYS